MPRAAPVPRWIKVKSPFSSPELSFILVTWSEKRWRRGTLDENETSTFVCTTMKTASRESASRGTSRDCLGLDTRSSLIRDLGHHATLLSCTASSFLTTCSFSTKHNVINIRQVSIYDMSFLSLRAGSQKLARRWSPASLFIFAAIAARARVILWACEQASLFSVVIFEITFFRGTLFRDFFAMAKIKCRENK